ncbi:MotA/TolQ/ExbB proton channel family protein [Planctomicrobium sp. SH661]|uniref:MotA/TolQ/ExbB proton channel family protein n=1 Tax=Planctomicrobium sp. SH661 TaxID=3448124 RepID=UPI003F5C6911
MQYLSAWRMRFLGTWFLILSQGTWAMAAEGEQIFNHGQLNLGALLRAGGLIGYIIIGLSIALVAAIIEHLITIRREVAMPRAVAEELQKQISTGQISQAEQLCKQRPTYLTDVIRAGLQESAFSYDAMEKAMEDTAVEHSGRLLRKIEYLSLIGALGPLLGLMGTVWGMIQAFAEFAEKANPSPADFAPAISEALVTTFFGLCVAVPALAAYAWFRNKIDELSSETALLCEYLMTPLRKSLREKRRPSVTATPVPPSIRSQS